jgi:hypothetical protein
LRAQRLARVGGAPGAIEPYHDRIRETVTTHLSPARLRQCHAALAAALEEAGGADPEALATHLQGAGDLVRAGEHAARAARSAAEALAFDRAARLYRLALDLAPGDARSRLQLQIDLATSLANAGRGNDAAGAFLAAAEAASDAQALDLRRRAAEQYLKSGHVDEGIATLALVLEPMGMRMAATPRRALVGILFRRALIRLRGLRHRERDASAIDPDELMRMDVCRAASLGLSMVDTVHGADFQGRYTLLALRAGEPSRMAVALMLEAAYTASVGGSRALRRGEKIMRRAEALACRIGDPYGLGLMEAAKGNMEYCQGRWRRTRDHCDRAAAILQDRCTGVAWEVDTAHVLGLWARFFLGEMADLTRRLEQLLDDAQIRGDLYVSTALRSSVANAGWLVADQVERARREVETARAQWSYAGFHLQDVWLILGEALLDLYAGDGSRAWERIEATWPAFRGSMLPRIRVVRAQMVHFRGVSALAAAAEARDASTAAKPLHVADRVAADLGRDPIASFHPLARLLRAGIAALRNDRRTASSLLGEAAAGFDAADMALYAAVARLRRGEMMAGDAGSSSIQDAQKWMAGQGIRSSERTCRMLAPGFTARD